MTFTIEDEEEIVDHIEKEREGLGEGVERGIGPGGVDGEISADAIDIMEKTSVGSGLIPTTHEDSDSFLPLPLSPSGSLSPTHFDENPCERENEFSLYVSKTFVPLRFDLSSLLSAIWNVYSDFLAIYESATRSAIQVLRLANSLLCIFFHFHSL